MKIQFDSRNGARAVKNGYIVKCIPWKDGSGQYYMWNITVQKAGEQELTDIEAYCHDISMLDMEMMMTWLTENAEEQPDEISRCIRKWLSWKKCNVYKVILTGDGSKKITDQSEGAGVPKLEFPGTRLDEIAD